MSRNQPNLRGQFKGNTCTRSDYQPARQRSRRNSEEADYKHESNPCWLCVTVMWRKQAVKPTTAQIVRSSQPGIHTSISSTDLLRMLPATYHCHYTVKESRLESLVPHLSCIYIVKGRCTMELVFLHMCPQFGLPRRTCRRQYVGQHFEACGFKNCTRVCEWNCEAKDRSCSLCCCNARR